MFDEIRSFPGLHNQTLSISREFSNGTFENVLTNQFVGFDNLDDYPHVTRSVLVQSDEGDVRNMSCSFIDKSLLPEWQWPPVIEQKCENSFVNGTFFYTMSTDSQSVNITIRSTPNWSGPSLVLEHSLNIQDLVVTRKNTIDGQVASEREYDLNSDGSETDETENKEDITPEPIPEPEEFEFEIEFEIMSEWKDEQYTEHNIEFTLNDKSIDLSE